MAEIKCPNCGEMNSAELEFCLYCQSRLKPLTGVLKGEDAIRPGQVPTPKVTSELEPILPQWLREAREKARKSAEEEATAAQQESPGSAAESAPNLLAGLESQAAADEEEVPDWLAGIQGSAPKSGKPTSEPQEVKWAELSGLDHFETPGDETGFPATQAPTESGTGGGPPPWMTPQEPAPERDELTDWMPQPGKDESTSRAEEPPVAPESDESWPRPSPTPAESAPEWLTSLQAETPAPGEAPSGQAVSSSHEVPDWLKNIESSVPAEAQSAEPALSEPESPDQLRSTAAPPPAFKSEPPAFTEQPAVQGETPGWLASLESAAGEAPPAPESGAQAFAPEPPAEGAAEPPALPDQPLSNSDVDAIFSSLQMPDWLTNAMPSQAFQPATPGLPPAAESDEAIAPADLPSWVQAMRPVESAVPELSVQPDDQALETRGPLAGLHGVLPAVPSVGPSSKPKAHSIKLQVSEEQEAHASLLEQILAAETTPVSMKSVSILLSQRVLRWAIAALLFVVLSVTLFAGTQVFALPAAFANETAAAIQAAESVPEGAPVLMVFDYDASLSGELEAVAAPLVDHLILLRHPRLTLLSTSPIGPALAEHFFAQTQAGHNYQRGKQYINLGYLPGGLAGVLAFAQDPRTSMPLAAELTSPWQTPPLQGVAHLSDFAAILIVTDSAEAGRIWIEQAGQYHGSSPFIVIASAQAGPMIRPYYASEQVSGLVTGLNGAVSVEQANGGRPGLVRRYWDAYSLGLLIAAMLIVAGGLWNLAQGVRSRSVAQGEA